MTSKDVQDVLESANVVVVDSRLDVGCAELRALQELLSPDELARAERFVTNRLRDSFIARRGRLRQIIGVAADCSPSGLRFAIDSGGKPRLASDNDRLRFNVTHSAQLMVCAFAYDREVGVDVEYIRRNIEWTDIAARFFAPLEQRAIAELPLALQPTAFYSCWTRKEAVIKATGEGLARSLSSFAVSVGAGNPSILVCDPSLGSPQDWFLSDISVEADYRGAVAVRTNGASVTLRVWSWQQLSSELTK